MNALISAIKDKQKIMFANEGRLLKKSFFGLIILALAFQTGEFGNIIRESMVDAYLAVSVFVGFTLMVFIGLDSLTKFDIHSFLEKTKNFHVPIASFLGAIPGCGGAIIVVTQYIQGRISFGSLVAVLTATMGDAAFLLIAQLPLTGMAMIVLGFVIGTLSGWVVNQIHASEYIDSSGCTSTIFTDKPTTTSSQVIMCPMHQLEHNSYCQACTNYQFMKEKQQYSMAMQHSIQDIYDTSSIIFIDQLPYCSSHDQDMKDWCGTCNKVVALRDQMAQMA